MVPFPKRYQCHQIQTPSPSCLSRYFRLPLVLVHPIYPLRGFSASPTSHFYLFRPALHLPTSFPISGLARFRVKPRLCRSSWRALCPLTRSCFLLLPLRRLSLLAPFSFLESAFLHRGVHPFLSMLSL